METELKSIFWEHVDKTNSCWNWTGTTHRGSPVLKFNSQKFYPRHISLYISGRPRLGKKQSRPWCKNKLCVNPDHLTNDDQTRFWSKVQKLSELNGGCWIWLGAEDRNGYGKFLLRHSGIKTDIRSHRYSWELSVGRSIPTNLQVCHKCDNPRCVNPCHLFLGTNSDNTQDRVDKGRSARGERQGHSKLTETQVKEIKSLSATTSVRKLSEIYGVRYQTIRAIINRKSWKHVQD